MNWKLILGVVVSLVVGVAVGHAQRPFGTGPTDPKYVDFALKKLCARSLENGERVTLIAEGFKSYARFTASYTDADQHSGSGAVDYPR